jgi:dienelactone hydrolase
VRKKWSESGGSPAQYIAGCREAIMPQARACVAKLIGVDNASEAANSPAEIDFPPPSGKGRVVVVISGIDGTSPYQDYAEKIAKLGYYTVLINGKDILSEDKQGGERLQDIIAKAQNSPSALPGKIAVIGFSLGGGGALAYAERQPEMVSTVITYYPFTQR